MSSSRCSCSFSMGFSVMATSTRREQKRSRMSHKSFPVLRCFCASAPSSLSFVYALSTKRTVEMTRPAIVPASFFPTIPTTSPPVVAAERTICQMRILLSFERRRSAHFSCVLCEYTTLPKHSRSCPSRIPRDCGVSSVWECGSKDIPPVVLRGPLLVLRGVGYRADCDVAAPPRLPLEESLAVYVLPAPWRLPVLLIGVLQRHPVEEVPAHVVVVQVRLVTVFVPFDELVGERVDEQATDRNAPLILPGAHHRSEERRVG